MKIWITMIDGGLVWPRSLLVAANSAGLGGGIGGAEAMTIGMARALITRGHDVTIWATKVDQPDVYGGVRWRDVNQELHAAYTEEPPPDVIVASRWATLFPFLAQSDALKVLWAQDIFVSRDPNYARDIQLADAFLYMSDWQRQEWRTTYPEIAESPSAITPAGIDPAWIVEDAPHYRGTFLYGSRPERGLVPLLQMWERIRAQVRNARLIITGYTQGVQVTEADALIAKTDESVTVLRTDDKTGFFAQLARARLLLYPGESWFRETCGHVTEDAMAAGVIPLVSRLGALSETVPVTAGVLFDGDAYAPDYQERFIAEAVRLSQPAADAEVLQRQAIGRAHVLPRCDYASIAMLWEKLFHAWSEKTIYA